MKKDQTQEVLIFEMEKKTGEKKNAGLRAGSDRLSGRNNDLDSKKHSATPLAPAVHWGTDHAVYCFYQICPNLCMCVFSLLFHLLIWLICPILSLFLVAIFLLLSSFVFHFVLVCMCMCVCLCTHADRVRSCVMLHCWEAPQSLTAV